MPKTQPLVCQRGLTLLTQTHRGDETVRRTVAEQVPLAGVAPELDIDMAAPKVRITLQPDASVAKFQRAQGQGSQAGGNRVLATYTPKKIAGRRAADARIERRAATDAAGRKARGPLGSRRLPVAAAARSSGGGRQMARTARLGARGRPQGSDSRPGS